MIATDIDSNLYRRGKCIKNIDDILQRSFKNGGFEVKEEWSRELGRLRRQSQAPEVFEFTSEYFNSSLTFFIANCAGEKASNGIVK